MNQATTALLDADLIVAEDVISIDESIEARYRELDEQSIVLLARQQPVATDLRTIVAALRISVDLQRMGVLARHVAEVARQRHPSCAVADSMRDTIRSMGEVAQRIIAKARGVIISKDAQAALALTANDDEMDLLHHELYRRLLSESYEPDARTVVDITLIGRFYERFADHAVSVARRVAYIAGEGALD
jgi:phosphate transport system protein